MTAERERRSGRRRRTWGQRLAIAAGCLSTLGLLASAAGLGYVLRKYERLPRIQLTGVLDEQAESGEPENYLIVGVDNAGDLPGDDPVRIGRDPTLHSDTIMVLRIDPASGRAALLSLPRDLFVPIPGTGTSRRINIAIELGGAPLLIRTINENFGIPIHHYVQVDFASFRGLVEAVGGVSVYLPHPARDAATGLDLGEGPGCRKLDPTEALAYVRSRHYEEFIDGRWVEDPRSDLGRIARQQDFIRRALRRAIDRGARNPGTLDQLIDVGLSGITVDGGLTAGDIFDLGTRFRSFDPDSLLTYSVSGTPGVVNGAQILRLIEGPETEATLAIFRGGTGTDLVPASVRLTVRNGTGTSRQGADATAALKEVGFIATVAGDEPGGGADGTVIRHPPAQAAAADLVARWLVGGARLEAVEGATGIELVTGADWQGVRPEPAPSTSATTATTLPSSTSSLPASGTPEGPAASARTSTSIDLAQFDC
ncbi:MAG TPA: LCP family protein [Acidimicrobiales bacterium]|nr:LCP family protein [Acidimicrobiales bacterium]